MSFIFFWLSCTVCRILSSLTRNWTRTTVAKVPTCNHWTTRESLHVPNNRICIGHVFVGLPRGTVSPHFLPYLFVYLGRGNQSPSPECPRVSSACFPGAPTGCWCQAVLVKKLFVHLIYKRGIWHVGIYKKLCFRLRSPNRHCRGCKKEQLCTSPETLVTGMDWVVLCTILVSTKYAAL